MLRLARWNRLGVVVVGSVAAAGLCPTAAQSQQGGIRGRVVDQATQRPLTSVQVFIPGSSLAALTDAQGNYVIQSVPTGVVTVQAQIIGYGTATAEAEVTAGDVARVDFELELRAVSLDEIVVTGTGAPARRRQLGQTINSVTSAELAGKPITNVTDILQGRIPGVTAQAVGETGAAAQILLRGAASLTQRNEPVIYVDGIRLDNSRATVSGTSANRLGDINPSDIERIEVIKGAAAATLFGTEASSGVIQIFTKRGATGDAIFSLQVDEGLIHLPNSKWPENSQYDAASGKVVTNKPAETLVDMGYHQNYHLSVRGGGSDIQYFISGRLMDEKNPMPNNDQTTASLRSSFNINRGDRLRAIVDLSWIDNSLTVPQPDWSSTASDFVLSRPNRGTPEFPYGRSGCICYDIPDLLKYKYTLDSKNVVLAGGLDYDLTPDIVASVKVGYNDVEQKGVAFRPEGITPPGQYLSRGYRRVEDGRNFATTVDASVNWDYAVSERVQSHLTVGGQSFWEGFERSTVSVENFPSPSLGTLSGGQNITGVGEEREEVINAGLFAQEQIGLDDRLFLTAGIRMDGNSAFGDDFGFSYYPKAGLSWVVSDYDFFDVSWVDDLRVRAAYGTSGLQPGAFDHQRTWTPSIFAGNVGIITPKNIGNPDLKPERSTEKEFAVEAGLFRGRLGLEAIYYSQVTTDALLPEANFPSTGFTNPQLVNIGEMTSKGIELTAHVSIMDSPTFGWNANGSYTWNKQRVTDMGEVTDYRITSRRRFNWIAEGYSPGVILAPIQDPNNPYHLSVPVENLTSLSQIESNVVRNEDGSEKNVYIGNSIPTWTTNFGTSFRFGRSLTLSTLFLGAGGFVMSNETEIIRSVARINPWTSQMEAKLANPSTSTAERQKIADEFGRKHPGVISSFMEDGDWLKLNEVALTYQIPEEISARFGLGQSTISLGGRNLVLWTKYSGMLDPGTTTRVDGVQSNFLQNIDYISTPSPRRYTLTIRTTW